MKDFKFKSTPKCELFLTAHEINTLIGSVNPKDEQELFRKLVLAREGFESELQAVKKCSPGATSELEELTDTYLDDYIKRNLDDEEDE